MALSRSDQATTLSEEGGNEYELLTISSSSLVVLSSRLNGFDSYFTLITGDTRHLYERTKGYAQVRSS